MVFGFITVVFSLHRLLVSYMDKRFEGVDKRFDDQKDETYRRFNEQKEETNRRFDEVDKKFESVDKKFVEVKSEVHELKIDIHGMRDRLDRYLDNIAVRMVTENIPKRKSV